jgi:hypothetical protein
MQMDIALDAIFDVKINLIFAFIATSKNVKGSNNVFCEADKDNSSNVSGTFSLA